MLPQGRLAPAFPPIKKNAGSSEARIAKVQSSTTSGIAEIERISQVIQEVTEIVTSIATAIDQQAAATRDIAQASEGVTDANIRVAQTSQASQAIAHDIASVDLAASGIADGSEQVRTSSAELTQVAGQLQAAVARFRITRA